MGAREPRNAALDAARNAAPNAARDAAAGELPSVRTLRRATLVAVVLVSFLAIGVVMPAETTRDPIGTGELLGLAEMGRIKSALAEEAAAEVLAESEAAAGTATAATATATATTTTATTSTTTETANRAAGESDRTAALPPTDGATNQPAGEPSPATSASAWRDSVTFTLQPGERIELKLAMREGQRAEYAWQTDGDEVYFNAHGEPPDAPRGFTAHTYSRGTEVADTGELVAVYDGIHGWLWRNRSDAAITITLRTRGDYSELREIP